MVDVVRRWRELEALLVERGLDWGLHHAPTQLRYARSDAHPLGARLDHLLPPDYLAFVAEVGYPVVGFSYYDRDGLTFLPPEAMARLSVDLPDANDSWPKSLDDEPALCSHAFFAGIDLSEVEGYAFGAPAGGGAPVVWEVDGMPRREVGPFAEWLDAEVTRLAEYALEVNPDRPSEEDDDDDPHRLLDYSLGGTYDQAPFTAEDLDLTWVESQEGTPYAYGLIDGTGRWRIPTGKQYLSVRPFRDGAAAVIRNEDGASLTGPWTSITADGTPR